MATLLRRRSKKKKILALAGAKGRHKNMFSAVMSTTARQLLRVRGSKAKEKVQKHEMPGPWGSL